MGRKAIRNMFHKFGDKKDVSVAQVWRGFVRKSMGKTRRYLASEAGDYLHEMKTEAAARASISKDPDQQTKVYPGFLRDSAYALVTKTRGDSIEGETGFTAPYALAHHEEAKDYRYGQMKFLESVADEKGAEDYIDRIR